MATRRSSLDVLTIVLLDVASIGIGLLVGWLLDGIAESTPLLALFGTLVGLVVAAVITWSRLKRPAGSP